MKAKGRVFKYKDNVDTDVIIPARYLNTFDPQELAAHCLEDLDPEFSQRVQAGISLCREKLWLRFFPGTCPLGHQDSEGLLRHCRHFCPDFYRNAINIGLPILESRKPPRGRSRR